MGMYDVTDLHPHVISEPEVFGHHQEKTATERILHNRKNGVTDEYRRQNSRYRAWMSYDLIDVIPVRGAGIERRENGDRLEGHDEDGIEQDGEEHVLMQTNPIDAQLPASY